MSNRTARIVKWAALPAALIISGVVVSQASYSAFTATTTNAGNNWNSGNLSLINDSASALFSVSNIKPGDWGSKCITVTAPKVVSGTTVAMNATVSAAGKSELNDLLAVKVTPGASCTPTTTPITFTPATTLASFITTPGVAAWSPAVDGASQKYLIEWVLNPAATTVNAGGKVSNIDFNWVANQGAGVQVPTPAP
ncbi:hypothetical protein NHF46_12870 [Arthrobacter alpinus]|nr:hypothetical protein [Arthrobacter alpinus]